MSLKYCLGCISISDISLLHHKISFLFPLGVFLCFVSQYVLIYICMSSVRVRVCACVHVRKNLCGVWMRARDRGEVEVGVIFGLILA